MNNNFSLRNELDLENCLHGKNIHEIEKYRWINIKTTMFAVSVDGSRVTMRANVL